MEGKREPCELKVSDFDDAMYTLEVQYGDARAGFWEVTRVCMLIRVARLIFPPRGIT